MDLKEIKQILQKYFNGESTEKEEQLLYDYFHSKTISPELEKYRNFFSGIQELANNRNLLFEEQVMDYILENEHREKKHYRWLWQAVSGIAAALVIALLAINYNNTQSQWKDTYSSPDQAYVEASRTLHFVAGQYQKGMENLQPIKKLGTATQPLKQGLDELNKGFLEIQKVEKVNKKLKEQ